MAKKVAKKSAQEIQDEIFRGMSAEKKLALGAGLWRLAMQVAGKKRKSDKSATTTAKFKNLYLSKRAEKLALEDLLKKMEF